MQTGRQHQVRWRTAFISLPPLTMNNQIYPLLVAQFLSAFADNAVLFTVVALIMQLAHFESWYVPAVQSAFYVAYIVLAPWAGEIADTHPKARVLFVANLIKAAGAGLLLLNVEPIVAYSLVGIGAAIYTPVKYGILPELAEHHQLVKANGLMEGSTILAILLGMVVGAAAADYSTSIALAGTAVIYLISALLTWFLPKGLIRKPEPGFKVIVFGKGISEFFNQPKSFFAIAGSAMFWTAAATLRVILIAWAPVVLLAKTASEIAELTLFLAIGIIIGSAIVPKLIPLEHIRRTRVPGYLMAAFIVILATTDSVSSARGVLVMIGMAGGMFIVPINALLQELGKDGIGCGRAVAVQNFFNSLAMLGGVGGYTFATLYQANPIDSMMALGFFVFAATFFITLGLRRRKTFLTDPT